MRVWDEYYKNRRLQSFFPRALYQKMMKVAPNHPAIGKRVRNIPTLVDLDQRFRIRQLSADVFEISSRSNLPAGKFLLTFEGGSSGFDLSVTLP